MLVTLELPFVDVRAMDLALTLGAGEEEAISVLKRERGAYRTELRLLGCSHQALVSGDGYRFSELVACRPGQQGPLPARASDRRDGRLYEFSARTRRLDPQEYAKQARRVMSRVATMEDGLVGTFPEPECAFTALRLITGEEAGLAWQTWHGYPQSGEIVFTSSRVSG